MNKLCVFDMDGTLLTKELKIDKSSLRAVSRLKSSGYGIVIATGRMDTMVKEYRDQLAMKMPIISCNGALIRDQCSGQVIHKQLMDKDHVLKIIDICDAFNVVYHLYGEHFPYGQAIEGRFIDLEKYNAGVDDDYKIQLKIVESCREMVAGGLPVLKVLIPNFDPETSSQIRQALASIGDLSVYNSGSGLLDVMAPGVTKGNALRILANHYDIDINDTVAFGDGHNDIDMLKAAGTPIAMENAVDALKSVAKFITKSNNDQGIENAVLNLLTLD